MFPNQDTPELGGGYGVNQRVFFAAQPTLQTETRTNASPLSTNVLNFRFGEANATRTLAQPTNNQYAMTTPTAELTQNQQITQMNELSKPNNLLPVVLNQDFLNIQKANHIKTGPVDLIKGSPIQQKPSTHSRVTPLGISEGFNSMYISSDSIQGTGQNLYNSQGLVSSNLRFKNASNPPSRGENQIKTQPSYKVYESNLAGSAFNDVLDKNVI